MALFEMPTGILTEEIVDVLPEEGEENKVYRRLVEDEALREMQITDDFIWHDGEWLPFSFDVKIYGAYFSIYKKSVQDIIADLEARIEALEGGGGILFEGDNIELTEAGATIGLEMDIQTGIKVEDGTVFKVTLSDMTIDGEPIDNVSGEITAYGLTDWDWQGGELYSEVFGNGAYFAFGTKPIRAVANKVTLGFVNESEDFDVRTLVIGHIKVEV